MHFTDYLHMIIGNWNMLKIIPADNAFIAVPQLHTKGNEKTQLYTWQTLNDPEL